jgi:hypothetical protein
MSESTKEEKPTFKKITNKNRKRLRRPSNDEEKNDGEKVKSDSDEEETLLAYVLFFCVILL